MRGVSTARSLVRSGLVRHDATGTAPCSVLSRSEKLKAGGGSLRLRDEATTQPWQIAVAGHVQGREEPCLFPAGVSCSVCHALYTREQYARHGHAADGTVEQRPPVKLRVDQAKKEVLNVIKKAKGTGVPNLVSGPMLRRMCH